MTDITSALDPLKRAELKAQLLDLMRKRHRAIDRGLQFEGVTLDNPTPENFALVLVIKDILQENREFSVVQWSGGIALVRTAQVDAINPDYQKVNESADFIIRGGSDKLFDFEDRVPRPVSTDGSDGTGGNGGTQE
jgi:hypothetical protein